MGFEEVNMLYLRNVNFSGSGIPAPGTERRAASYTAIGEMQAKLSEAKLDHIFFNLRLGVSDGLLYIVLTAANNTTDDPFPNGYGGFLVGYRPVATADPSARRLKYRARK
jgi:hypothetical protein